VVFMIAKFKVFDLGTSGFPSLSPVMRVQELKKCGTTQAWRILAHVLETWRIKAAAAQEDEVSDDVYSRLG
jgi:hypothetical protein